MAILAIYSSASSIEFVSSEGKVCERAVFPKAEESLEQVVNWLNSLPLKVEGHQFIITNGTKAVPNASGVYSFSDHLIDSKLISALINRLNLPAYVLDPPCLNECYPEAFITGTPILRRKCLVDTVLLKYLARKEAEVKNLCLNSSSFIIAHLDEDIHLGALVGTTVVDCLSSNDEGPFALRQAGGLPFDRLLDLCLATGERNQTLKILEEESGLKGYLGFDTLQDSMDDQSDRAQFIREALAYQVSKEIGAFATVLKGNIQSIILSGELVKNEEFTAELVRRIQTLGSISIYPGNQGINALLAGVKRLYDQESVLEHK